MHRLGEHAQLTDDQLEGAGLFLRAAQLGHLRIEPGDTPPRLCDARLELVLGDEPLGVAVDQATECLSKSLVLARHDVELVPVWAA